MRLTRLARSSCVRTGKININLEKCESLEWFIKQISPPLYEIKWPMGPFKIYQLWNFSISVVLSFTCSLSAFWVIVNIAAGLFLSWKLTYDWSFSDRSNLNGFPQSHSILHAWQPARIYGHLQCLIVIWLWFIGFARRWILLLISSKKFPLRTMDSLKDNDVLLQKDFLKISSVMWWLG